MNFGSRLRQKSFSSRARRSFDSWRSFFEKISGLTHSQLTLRELKRWRMGQALPVLGVVKAICSLERTDWRSLGVELLPANWGQRRGGRMKVAQHGCNLTLQDRMNGGKMTGRSNSMEHMRAIASLGGPKVKQTSISQNKRPERRQDDG